MGKRKYAVLLSLFLLLACCQTISYGRETDGNVPPVSMEISSVYGNLGKMGVHVPVSVSLYGQSDTSFSGTVTISALENDSDNKEELFQYIYPVKIRTAETKNIEIYVPLGQKSSRIYAALKDESGKTVLERSLQFEISRDEGRLLIGTLSDHADELTYLNEISMEYGMIMTKQIAFDESLFPEDERGLEVLDVIVVNDFDTSKLSDRQTEAVWKWVKNGGVLLVGTGLKAEKTLAAFSEYFDVSCADGGDYENINLGMEFTEKAPGDSDIRMYCRDISMSDGTVVEESDGIPLLISKNCKDGVVGVYSYDMGDVGAFIEKNPTYVNKMITDILGERRISNIYYYSAYGSDQEYWNAYSMLNTGNADRLPNLMLYAVVIVLYIGAVGPGLYLFLKKKDKSRLYSASAAFLSVIVSGVIYLLGAETRFTSQFLTTASVIEIDKNQMEETSYINVQTPDSRSLALTIPSDYKVTPLTKSSRYSEQPVRDFSGHEKSALEIKFSENGTRISAGRTAAFKPRFFKLSKEDQTGKNGTVAGMIHWSDGKISGHVKNNMPFELKKAIILLYGQMYQLGDLKPGEERILEKEETIVWPVGMSYVAAEKMAEEKIGDTVSKNSAKSSLYGFYLDKNFQNYTSEAYLLAWGDEAGIMNVYSLKDQIADSAALYAVRLDVDSGTAGYVYRSGMSSKPEVNSGSSSFYGDGMTMYGTDPVVVEYFLGTDIEVEKISFLPVSESFLENSDYSYLKLFDGSLFFYNRMTKEYDRADLSKTEFSAEELSPYLSQKNSFIVKYTTGDAESVGMSSLLPHLMVTGREP